MNKGIVSVIIFLILSVMMILGRVGYPLVMFLLEDEIVKTELNNAYINENYMGWQTISVDKIGTFKMPGDWQLYQEIDGYCVKNEKKEIIAYATVTGDSSSKYSGIKSFVESIIGEKIDEIDYQYNNGFANRNGSGFFSLVARKETTQQLFHCIRLENNSLKPFMEGTIDFVFVIKDDAEPYEELFLIAEAVVYSYEQERKTG